MNEIALIIAMILTGCYVYYLFNIEEKINNLEKHIKAIKKAMKS